MAAICLYVLVATVVAGGVALFAIGAADIRSGIFAKAICRLPADRGRLPFTIPGGQPILLTFDDGPDPDITPRVLDVLDKHGHRAIFFVIGSKAEAHPELVREIVRRGHMVGNHTYRHSPWANFLGTRHLLADIGRTDRIIESACGVRPVLFRPPLGVCPHFLRRVVRRSGHVVVGWSVRSLDTRGEAREVVIRRIRRKLRRGGIVLLHDRLPGADLLAEATLSMPLPD